MSNFLALANQKQLWIYNKKEENLLADAITHRIYDLEKKIFLKKQQIEEINTLTILLNRLGYNLSEDFKNRFSGEWTRSRGKIEYYHRVTS